MARKAAKRAPRTSNVPDDESKADRFKRLGTMRINKAIKTIKLIGNLSGSGYEYTQEQVAAIESNLKKAVIETLAKFDKTKKAEAETVTL